VNDLYLVAAVGEWNRKLFQSNTKSDKAKWDYVSSPEELKNYLSENNPNYIFFPHWRWIVPPEVVNKYNCVCFHMTDLPFGRGGSPLQNLIIRGYKETVLTAVKMDEGLDTGPIYFKEPLNLDGTAQEIYIRATELIWPLIRKILDEKPIPEPQVGESVVFKRRLPVESELPDLDSLEKIYDFIRMLDAPGYPHAFLEIGMYKINFTKASLSNAELTAKVTIQLKEADRG